MSQANVFAIAAALIVAGVAGWLALTPNPSIAGPIGIFCLLNGITTFLWCSTKLSSSRFR